MLPSDGVRAGVPVADEVEGGGVGVGLFRRPPVSERKAVKSAWAEERRSGVCGTWSDGGDMRRGVAGRGSPWSRKDTPELLLYGPEESAMRVAQAHRVYHGCWAARKRGCECPFVVAGGGRGKAATREGGNGSQTWARGGGDGTWRAQVRGISSYDGRLDRLENHRQSGYLIPTTLELWLSVGKWVGPNSNHLQTSKLLFVAFFSLLLFGLFCLPWLPTSPLSHSCSRPAWTLGRTSKVSHFCLPQCPMRCSPELFSGSLRIYNRCFQDCKYCV
jgi:hypothetical protein